MATYKLYRDEQRKFRWSLRSDNNGNIIAVSSEAYDSKQGAEQSIEWVKANANAAKIENET